MQKFATGQTVMTRGVYDLADMEPEFRDFALLSFARHICGDWGDLDPEDKESNDEALLNGDRLVSAYEYPDPEHKDWKIWIITEWDRSATTILFPHEY